MARASVLGSLEIIVLIATLASPSPLLMVIGFSIMAFVGLCWLILATNANLFNQAINRTATINNNLSGLNREVMTEPDPAYEKNAGIRRWKEQ